MSTTTNKKDQELALLKVRMQAPMIVRDLLATNLKLDSDMQFSLSEMISNMDAINTLLCAALSMKEINDFKDAGAQCKNLAGLECERILERYHENAAINGPEWDIKTLAEDLENFIEMAELCHMSYEILDPKIAAIINVLCAQINAQIMIVDHVIAYMNAQEQHGHKSLKVSAYKTGYAADNIVMFPGR